MDPVLHSLLESWRLQGIRIAHGASDDEVGEFERKYNVHLCSEFRSYIKTVNGMLQSSHDQCDSNLFAFWQLDRIRPVAEECPELQVTPEEGLYFVFADYMIWSWAYAVDLRANSPTSGKVILVGGVRQQCIASSFYEFLRLYVQVRLPR